MCTRPYRQAIHATHIAFLSFHFEEPEREYGVFWLTADKTNLPCHQPLRWIMSACVCECVWKRGCAPLSFYACLSSSSTSQHMYDKWKSLLLLAHLKTRPCTNTNFRTFSFLRGPPKKAGLSSWANATSLWVLKERTVKIRSSLSDAPASLVFDEKKYGATCFLFTNYFILLVLLELRQDEKRDAHTAIHHFPNNPNARCRRQDLSLISKRPLHKEDRGWPQNWPPIFFLFFSFFSVISFAVHISCKKRTKRLRAECIFFSEEEALLSNMGLDATLYL